MDLFGYHGGSDGGSELWLPTAEYLFSFITSDFLLPSLSCCCSFSLRLWVLPRWLLQLTHDGLISKAGKGCVHREIVNVDKVVRKWPEFYWHCHTVIHGSRRSGCSLLVSPPGFLHSEISHTDQWPLQEHHRKVRHVFIMHAILMKFSKTLMKFLFRRPFH